ncbi:BIG/ATPase V1 complex, subunit S1 [Biscogniauxia marginata]|nr:BIG/ATPase V1 complex, subunit S1 [Biscogniauxia marginata]
MRLSVTATVAALCASAQAFSDSSPFILFSTAKIPEPASSQHNEQQLQSSAQVLSSAKQLLSSCPTDRYLIVSQPGLNAGRHLRSAGDVPSLTRALDGAASRYSVAEVVSSDEDLDLRQIAQYIRETCGAAGSAVDELDLDPVSSPATLKENDDELGLMLQLYEAEGSYTVVYAGGPRTETPGTYTADFQDGVHTELKRQLQQGVARRAGYADRKLGLFDKYQFFTPGIFMALIALVVLLSILYAGVSAVASLEVSYGAFDKEMGPAAQKKQQ